ncbi:Ig-like domain-containing protein [Paenibacillus sp. KS-LC4]|uniref:Ig-like domain-containing protein n=1 Tax=Paenibacillus sp. KS-LC4 TaxID=2979727 RepID=UPI0030CF2792
MNTRKKKKMLLICTAWLLIVSNLFSITAFAGPAPIYNQNGTSYSGTIAASPIGDTFEMEGYSDWPAGFTQNNDFSSGIFDGESIWMLPGRAAGLIKIDKDTGAMAGYTAWPDGFVRGSSKPDFLSGVFDGQSIWMIPYGADRVIKVDKDTGVMTGYNDWPSGFTLPSTATNPNPFYTPMANFSGGVFDGQNIWMVPYGSNYVIKINKDTGVMTGYNDWPSDVQLTSQGVTVPNGGFLVTGNFNGGIFDGQSIWMVPGGVDRIVKIDKDTGEMTSYSDWPSGYTKDYINPSGFSGGIFDGQNIWLTPLGADRVIKIDKDTGVMTGYDNWPSSIASGSQYFTGVFDGQNIWMLPRISSDQLVKMDKDTGEMTAFDNWPSTTTIGMGPFSGGVFDGRSIWMVPGTADQVVKLGGVTVPVTGVTVSPATLTLTAGGNAGTVTAVVSPSNATNKKVTWTSSDPSVATVDEDGVVTPLTAGTVTITATTEDGGQMATSSVTINEADVLVTGVTVSPATLTLTAGGNAGTVTAVVSPSNATNKKVTWTSSDPSVATVDEDGVVTPLTAGTVTITGTTEDGGKTATSTVTINETDVLVTGVTVSPATLTLTAGGNAGTVTAGVSPSNATNKKVTWTSSDPSVATVDEDGVVTPLTAGTVTITGTTEDGGKTATSIVTVNETDVAVTGVTVSPAAITLTAGGSPGTVTAGVSPSNATNKKVTWTSSDPSVATVDEDGVVTPLTAGTVTITGTTEDGGKTATSIVTVNETDVAVTGVTVSPAAITLTAGGSPGTVTAGVSPSNATNKKVTWTSSDPTVATVDEDGVVTPLTAGTVTITGTTEDGGKAATSTVRVNASGAPAPTALTGAAGNGTVTLSWTGAPGAVSYSIYVSPMAGNYGTVPTPIAVVSSENFTVTGLTNGTTYYFIVTANNEEGTGGYSNEASATPRTGSQGSGGDSSSGSNGSSGSSAPSANGGQVALEGFRVIVNGKEYDQIATGNTTKQDGKSTLTATVDTNKLTAQLAKEGGNSTIIIPVEGVSSDKVSTVLTGDAVKAMENNQAILEVRTANGNYKLPASEISIDSLSSQLGVQVKLTDIVVRVDIAKSNDASIELVKNTAGKDGFSVVLPPVDFTVTASYNGKTVVVDKFSSYVQREIPLPAGTDLSKITTATVLLEDGTVYHVPTYVTQHDKNYYAVVSSLTNSIYTLIWNPLTFADVEGHWSKDAVNDMGSRIIVKGIDDTHYNPNAAITRSEFSAIIVRALGLAENGKTTSFNDVSSGSWYMGAVAKAQEYGIIKGYEDGAFRPNKTITRQEAMVMLERAMKLTGLNTAVSEAEVASALASFTDGTAVDAWAKQAVAATINSGLVQGRDAGLKPTSNITRAETAVIVQRMLIKAELIDLGNSK